MDEQFIDIIRYDGTRFITEEEIDKEFTGQWVLIGINDDLDREGYLLASAEGIDENRSLIEDYAFTIDSTESKIIYGCESRGDNLHVMLLD